MIIIIDNKDIDIESLDEQLKTEDIFINEELKEFIEDKLNEGYVEGIFNHYNELQTYNGECFWKIKKDCFTLDDMTRYQEHIQEELGLNIVTCGQCGFVVLHRTDLEEIKCCHCGFESEITDFPDLFFS